MKTYGVNIHETSDVPRGAVRLPTINGSSCPIMRQQSQQYYFEWFACFDTQSHVAKAGCELDILCQGRS